MRTEWRNHGDTARAAGCAMEDMRQETASKSTGRSSQTLHALLQREARTDMRGRGVEEEAERIMKEREKREMEERDHFLDLEESHPTSQRKMRQVQHSQRLWQSHVCPSHRLPGLLLASLLLAGAMAGPTLQAMEDVVIKACANAAVAALQCPAASSCQDGEAQLVLGHSDPTLIGSLLVSIQTISPSLSSADSPLRDVVVRLISGQKVVTVCPRGKAYGRSTIFLKVTDAEGKSILTNFGIVVQPLAPVFDDAGPTR